MNGLKRVAMRLKRPERRARRFEFERHDRMAMVFGGRLSTGGTWLFFTGPFVALLRNGNGLEACSMLLLGGVLVGVGTLMEGMATYKADLLAERKRRKARREVRVNARAMATWTQHSARKLIRRP